jgi:hypothetical protein
MSADDPDDPDYIDDSFVSVGEANSGSRKKTTNPTRRDLEKQRKYARPTGYNSFVPCPHTTSKFRCKMFSPNDCSTLRNKLLSVPEKTAQDNFIASFISLQPIKRRRPRPKSKNQRPNAHNVSYSLVTKDRRVIPVCKKFFCSVMLVKPTRLRTITTSVSKGLHITEKRGGDRKSQKSAVKKQMVVDFIKKLRGKESHYSRKKSKRIYLDYNLNITKLWKLYNSKADSEDKVSKTMFRNIFNTFNIGFRSPASDVCSYCLKTKNLIKTTTDPRKKIEYMTQKRVHSKRAAAFYKLMKKEVDESVTICFDLQQIQPLPKSPIQEAYYSRQLNFYCFCIVNIDGSNPTFYVWTEDQGGKGSIEVSSALLHYLENMTLPDNVKTVRMFCDGCGSQNKNNFVLHSLMYAVMTNKCKADIELTFPVRGHSFLPADRTFGRVEKIFRKMATIVQKEEYIEVYKSIGKVMILGKDWELYDTKALSAKEVGCFQRLTGISDFKRIAIKKSEVKIKGGGVKKVVRVRGMKNFICDFEAETWQSLLKKGWTLQRCANITLNKVPLSHAITCAKKSDVKKLLGNIFGEGWEKDETLKWYRNILTNTPDGNDENEDEEELCNCLDDDIGLQI